MPLSKITGLEEVPGNECCLKTDLWGCIYRELKSLKVHTIFWSGKKKYLIWAIHDFECPSCWVLYSLLWVYTLLYTLAAFLGPGWPHPSPTWTYSETIELSIYNKVSFNSAFIQMRVSFLNNRILFNWILLSGYDSPWKWFQSFFIHNCLKLQK